MKSLRSSSTILCIPCNCFEAFSLEFINIRVLFFKHLLILESIGKIKRENVIKNLTNVETFYIYKKNLS